MVRYKRSCDYFANFSGWGVEDFTFNFLLKDLPKRQVVTKPDWGDGKITDINPNDGSMIVTNPDGKKAYVPPSPKMNVINAMEEQTNNLNRGQMATLDALQMKECPILFSDDKNLQNQFCKFREKKWQEYVEKCQSEPETNYCKDDQSTEGTNYFDEYGRPSQGFEDEVAFVFKDALESQKIAKDKAEKLKNINPEFEKLKNWTDLEEDSSRIYKIIKTDFFNFYKEPGEDSTHSWIRLPLFATYPLDNALRNSIGNTMTAYLLLRESEFAENLRALDQNLKNLKKDFETQTKLGQKIQNEFMQDKYDNDILNYLPSFAVKLLAIRVFRHFLPPSEIVKTILSNIRASKGSLDALVSGEEAEPVSDEETLRSCIKDLQEKVLRKIFRSKEISIAFKHYLMMASLGPRGASI